MFFSRSPPTFVLFGHLLYSNRSNIMRKSFSTLCVGLLLLSLSLAMVWPDKLSDQLKEKFQSYSEFFTGEYVYLQSDKMHYQAGETVWLAAYIRSQARFEPTSTSEILHVELWDAKGKKRLARGLKINKGQAEGTLELPKNLASAAYTIRAYTHWQLNEKSPAVFDKQIFVKGKEEVEQAKNTEIASTYKLDLLPEGGYLVEGLKSRIAFKMTNEKGLPVATEGLIKDQTGKELGHFSSEMNGMGTFDIRPEKGMSYQVEITKPSQTNVKQNLPQPLPSGLVLRLEEVQDEVALITVEASSAQKLGIVLQQRHTMLFNHVQEVQAGENSLRIPLEKAGMGIAQLTIFDEKERALAERLIFAKPDEQLKISVQTDKKEYGPREEVKLSLTVSDSKGRPVGADLSLAAIDANLAEAAKGKGSNMLTWMSFESELKGKIINPQSYLLSHKPSRSLDLMLMTHGWRRYDWQEALGQLPGRPAFPAEQMMLSGTVINAYNQQAIAGAEVMINDHEAVVKTDESGRFSLPRTHPERPVTLFISAPGFGTQQQRIVGVPAELQYKLRVQPIVTPETSTSLQVFAGNLPFPDFRPNPKSALPPFAKMASWTWPEQVEIAASSDPIASVPSNFDKENKTLNLGVVSITKSRVPVFTRDPNDQSKTSFDEKEIGNLSVRDPNDIISLSPGVFQADARSSEIYVRGADAASNLILFDGVKVRGGHNLPKMAMKKVEVYLSGAPAEFGDFTGGVIVMESKGPRMLYMMDTVATIISPPQVENLEEVLSKLSPIAGEVYGHCTMRVFVDEDGKYKRAKIIESSHRAWEKALKPHLATLSFEPAMTDIGTPYPYQVDMPFYFYADQELARDFKTDTLQLPELKSTSDFYSARSYYVPSAAELGDREDIRTTLFWTGHIEVPSSGKAVFRFRTSDNCSHFRIRIEGIGKNGELASF